jgi:hypothetical protein
MAGVLNHNASQTLAIVRVGFLNTQQVAVTGSATQPEFRIYSGSSTNSMTWTGLTAQAPISHDSNNPAMGSNSIGYAGTPGGPTARTLRRIFWSSDEPAISTATSDELECYVPLNIIWDAGYGDSGVQRLTLRTDQGAVVYNTVGASGILDTWIEFTHTSA